MKLEIRDIPFLRQKNQFLGKKCQRKTAQMGRKFIVQLNLGMKHGINNSIEKRRVSKYSDINTPRE